MEGVRGLDDVFISLGHPTSTDEELSEALSQRLNESDNENNPPVFEINDTNSDDDFEP